MYADARLLVNNEQVLVFEKYFQCGRVRAPWSRRSRLWRFLQGDEHTLLELERRLARAAVYQNVSARYQLSYSRPALIWHGARKENVQALGPIGDKLHTRIIARCS